MKRSVGATLSDVARKAGVNRVTASVVLNNATANTRVSEATRQRILSAAADLCYQPNAVARSLRRRRTDLIGFYSKFTDAGNPFLGQIISGLQSGCRRSRKNLLLHLLHDGRPDEIYAELANGLIDGLVFYAPPGDPLVGLLASSHLPVVALADTVPEFPTVGVDDAMGGRLQAAHLAARGHRRVFYLTVEAEPSSVARRRTAFCAEAESRMAVTVRAMPNVEGPLVGALRADVVEALRTGHTALVGWEDLTAYRLLSLALSLGRRIPEEVAVVGFDGIAQHSIEPVWRMTTIRAPWREVARTALTLLVDQIEGKEVGAETALPVELVLGNTT